MLMSRSLTSPTSPPGSVSWSARARKAIMLIIAGSTCFLLILHAGSSDTRNYLSSLPVVTESDRDTLTLGVAKKIYVLSLPNRTDRHQEMEKLREALGLRWKYIDALDSKVQVIEKILDSVRAIRAMDDGLFTWPEMPLVSDNLSLWSLGFLSLSAKFPHNSQADPLVSARQNNSFLPFGPNLPEYLILTPARIACWYSHLSVIENVANDKSLKANDTVLVLEDDIDMEVDIQARLEHLWTFLPEQWDIVYLGHCWSNETFYPPLNANDNATALNRTVTHIHPSKTPACSHAYALTRAGARRILVHLRYPPFAFSRPFDMAVSWLVQNNRVKSFSLYPSIVVQRKITNSDIMPGFGSTWKDELVNGVFDSRSA